MTKVDDIEKKDKITTWSFACDKEQQARKWVEVLSDCRNDPTLNQSRNKKASVIENPEEKTMQPDLKKTVYL